MRRFSLANLLLLVTIAGISFAVIGPNFRESERFSAAAEAEADSRRSKINQEVALLNNHAWAGSYYCGDGLGVNLYLSLAPKSGFVFEWHGCLGTYDRNYGAVKQANGPISLQPKFPNLREGFRGMATEYLPVAWGSRHYLVPPNEMVEFCNDVNSGTVSTFLLRRGDETLPVVGQPQVPDRYRAYLVDQPITGSVVAVTTVTPQNAIITNPKVMVTLDVGTEHGVLPEMKFHVIESTQSLGSVTIEKVEQHQSVGHFEMKLGDEPVPWKGAKVSTRSPFAEDESRP